MVSLGLADRECQFLVFQAMLIVPNAVRADPLVPTTELLQPPNYNEVIYDPKDEAE